MCELSSHRQLMGLFFTIFFFFNDTATTEIYTLSLHDALPIFESKQQAVQIHRHDLCGLDGGQRLRDRKSTRLNSSHHSISYAVFCLKKNDHRWQLGPPHQTVTHPIEGTRPERGSHRAHSSRMRCRLPHAAESSPPRFFFF